MEETVLKTKQEIINALREDVKILQIYFSSVYRARIDPCKKRVGVNEFKSLLETYHNKIAGSDYLYSAIKLCLNEFDYIRKNLRRHGEEYSLDSLIEYYKKTDALFTEAHDALIEEIVEINKEEDLLLQNRYSQGC